ETPTARSKTVLLAKNLPMGTKTEELQNLFAKYGLVNRVLLPPFGITAIIEMQEAREAKNAFKNLAYTNFNHCPLYLEWAPSNVFKEGEQTTNCVQNSKNTEVLLTDTKVDEAEKPEDDTTIFIKNLNFKTNEEAIEHHFEKCGKVYKVTVARKRHPNGSLLPIGYGFIQFMFKKAALKAMKEMQNSVLDDHALQLKLSRQSASTQKNFERKRVIEKQPGTKILIRNIPFEATVKDVKELFSSFGDLKFVRLPKKLSGVGSHRGFGFAEFSTKSGAKKAMESLGESTHLYGRRLALEWALEESEERDAFDSRKRDVANNVSELARGMQCSCKLMIQVIRAEHASMSLLWEML
ncbi:putative RNA-binding protein 19-like isoform X2, partial [Leptotrombidium deliense]